MVENKKQSDPESIAKIRRDLVEVEDLVYQILFFSHHSNDTTYLRVIITNLAKKILTYLDIEHKDIEHLFKHDQGYHNLLVHTAREKPEQLHLELKKQEAKIKKAVARIPEICAELTDGKVMIEKFRSELEVYCGEVLKLAGSENHELAYAKEFIEKATK